MFVIANLLITIARLSDMLLTIYMYMIIGRAIISWVNPDPYNPIVKFLYRATEPLLAKIRSRIPYMGGLDLSPMLIILAIFFLQNFVVRTVTELGYRLKTGGLL